MAVSGDDTSAHAQATACLRQFDADQKHQQLSAKIGETEMRRRKLGDDGYYAPVPPASDIDIVLSACNACVGFIVDTTGCAVFSSNQLQPQTYKLYL